MEGEGAASLHREKVSVVLYVLCHQRYQQIKTNSEGEPFEHLGYFYYGNLV